MLANNGRITLAAGAHPRRPVRQLPGDERRLGPVARALLGHAAADLGLRRDRLHGGRGLLRGAAGQAGRRGLRGLGAGQAANPDLPDHLKIHKPYIDAVTYDSPKAPGKRMRRVGDVIDCWFDSGAMPFAQWGYPRPARLAAAVPRPVSRPTSSARPSTRPAAGSTACWRSARCCSARNRRRRRHGARAKPQAALPRRRPACDARGRRPAGEADPRRSLSAPLPQLHRAGADARRRRAEDVQEQAELPRAATRFSTATGPTPCAGTSSPTSRRGPRSATASRPSRRRSPSSCCGCGTSTASS